MTVAEFKLLIILALTFCIFTFIFKQDPRRNTVVFLIACLTGFAAQIPLGQEINHYTPNIALYISYVSFAVIITWGIGLTSLYAAHLWVADKLRIAPGAALYFFCSFPIVIILEITGSNFVHMKLHDFQTYAPLLPQFNAMHAPPWLYGYYLLIALFFFYLLRALPLPVELPKRSVIGSAPVICDPQEIKKSI